MPNRILKESICRSETISQLSWFEEVLFYRLIVVCDDYGRFDGRPAIIKGTCFPLSDVTVKTIEGALSRLLTVGLVRGYEVQGRPILQLTTWGNHQQIRAKKSKYPSCDEIGNQMISGDYNNSRESKSESESKNDILCAREGELRLQEFAAAYPKPGGDSPGVGVEYLNVLKMGISEDDLIQAARNYADSCRIKGTTERYILNPENFLRKLAFDSYLPGKYRPPKPAKQTGVEQYNTFMKNDYDFDALEKELLGGGAG